VNFADWFLEDKSAVIVGGASGMARASAEMLRAADSIRVTIVEG
jgi:NAD(P)-dependent dehydrogenase (short-subunit alcohol dehydrogenase family)